MTRIDRGGDTPNIQEGLGAPPKLSGSDQNISKLGPSDIKQGQLAKHQADSAKEPFRGTLLPQSSTANINILGIYSFGGTDSEIDIYSDDDSSFGSIESDYSDNEAPDSIDSSINPKAPLSDTVKTLLQTRAAISNEDDLMIFDGKNIGANKSLTHEEQESYYDEARLCSELKPEFRDAYLDSGGDIQSLANKRTELQQEHSKNTKKSDKLSKRASGFRGKFRASSLEAKRAKIKESNEAITKEMRKLDTLILEQAPVDKATDYIDLVMQDKNQTLLPRTADDKASAGQIHGGAAKNFVARLQRRGRDDLMAKTLTAAIGGVALTASRNTPPLRENNFQRYVTSAVLSQGLSTAVGGKTQSLTDAASPLYEKHFKNAVTKEGVTNYAGDVKSLINNALESNPTIAKGIGDAIKILDAAKQQKIEAALKDGLSPAEAEKKAMEGSGAQLFANQITLGLVAPNLAKQDKDLGIALQRAMAPTQKTADPTKAGPKIVLAQNTWNENLMPEITKKLEGL